MRRRSMHSHILTKKTTARKRRLRGEVAVSRAAQGMLEQLLHK
jgi:ribosomal protein L35